MPAATQRAVFTEASAVSLALRPLAGSDVLENAVGVGALAELLEEGAFWHSARVVLVQVVAPVPFHAEIPKPMTTYLGMPATS